MNRFIQWLFRRVDISFLAYFRIAFGSIMLWEVWRYVSTDTIYAHYIAPAFHFTYDGFSWVKPLPGEWMYAHFILLGVLAACITIGFYYRLSIILFFLGFTYMFLLEQAKYLNHFYLICLVSFLLIFLPAHRAWSMDAAIQPKLRSETAPNWTLWLLRIQIGIVYFFGGIAKMNGDWLRGEPLRDWLGRSTDFPLIGRFFTEEWMVLFMSYGGLLLDLFIVPFLIWRRTRVPAFLIAVLFHLMNARLFSIGIFPWFMIAATALFFEPDFPRRVLMWFSSAFSGKEVNEAPQEGEQMRIFTASLLGVYLLLQVLIPLRHFLIPGNVSWTEEGHKFSWHMKLRDKDPFETLLTVTDTVTGETWTEHSNDYLTCRQATKMAGRPDMILQFAQYLAEKIEAERGHPVEIRAHALVSLNGREPQMLIDQTVNLRHEQMALFRHTPWVTQLVTPLQKTQIAISQSLSDI